MRKNLAALIAVSAITSFASSASASFAPATSASPQAGASVHTGAITALCELRVTNGTLPSTTTVLSPTIISSTLATIGTKCNTATAQLVVDLDTHTFGTDDPGVQAITRSFQLTSPVGAYNVAYGGGGLIGSYQTTSQTFSALNHGYSTTASSLRVRARVDAPINQNLADGAYTVNLKATLTP